MTTQIQEQVRSRRTSDFEITFWEGDVPFEELRAAFGGKWNWVVAPAQDGAFFYSTVLSNLRCRYEDPERATLGGIRQSLQRGLKRRAFDRLKLLIGVSSEDLGRVIRLSSRTLARREIFKPEESERILRVASVFQRALQVLGDLETARRWFLTPKRFLGEKTPLEFCDTEPGAEEVNHLLGRIEQGIFT